MACVAVFGLPASGKGTLAQRMSSQWGWAQLSTGDMIRRLRKEPGPIGDELRAMPTGSFARDDLIVEAALGELADPKYAKGVIFDGFPRTLGQLKALDEAGFAIQAALVLEADEESLVERALSRRVHVGSGRVYNMKTAPPKQEGRDDITGEELAWRADDKEDIARARFADYWLKTYPVVRDLESRGSLGLLTHARLDARGNADSVWMQAQEVLEPLARARKNMKLA